VFWTNSVWHWSYPFSIDSQKSHYVDQSRIPDNFPLFSPLFIFGINDVYDYESDIVNPRKLASNLEGGVLPPVYHPVVRAVAYVSTLFILCISFATLNLQNVLSTALLVFLGWQYSAPPFRLKEIPIIDSLTNGAIVFLNWFVGYSFGRGKLQEWPSGGVVLSLCTTGVHALGAAVDVESDIVSGQTTIATSFGPRTAAIFGLASFVIALLINHSSNTIFSTYLWGAVLIMMAPCVHLDWTHPAFKAVVHWTVVMVMIWLCSKVVTCVKVSTPN